MIRVAVDTNVVVSGVLVDEGLPASILDLAANKAILMIVTADVLAEYENVLRRPRFRISQSRIGQVLSVIRKTSLLVETGRTLSISRDEADNRFYECAEAGKADYLITGNTKHFPLNHKGTKIVTPREFIELVGPALAGGNS
jgi:putative PIN family toxin of toxin-antitoxin system